MENTEFHNPKNPFSLPDNYFDSFTDKMLERVEVEENLERGFTFNLTVLKPYIGLVGMFLISILLMQVIMWTEPYFTDNDDQIIGSSATTFNPSEEDIVDYLIYEMSSNEIMMALLE